MISPFHVAIERHGILEQASRHQRNESQFLWETFVGKISDDSYTLEHTEYENLKERQESLKDTIPEDFIGLLRTDEIAAVNAFECLYSSFTNFDLKGFELRESFRKKWEEFKKNANDAAHMMEGFGWDSSTAWKSYREITSSSNINTDAVIRIAKLASRMYLAMKGGAAKLCLNTPAEICAVTSGSDLSRLIPAEMGLLGVNFLQDLQLMRIATGKATIYQTKGEQKKSKGPLVLCVDESGSMHGQRHEWSAATMIALSRVAKDEKRQVSIVHFSTSVLVQDLDPSNPAEITKLIQTHLSGGTNIALALRAATKKVAEMRKKSGVLADVILLTDGIDEGKDIPNAVNDLVKECQLWSVAIDCQIPEENPLRKFAKEYIHITGELTAQKSIPLVKAAK